jgi:ubiquinone/menaquinone biosynthesis C-methylase UbiE
LAWLNLHRAPSQASLALRLRRLHRVFEIGAIRREDLPAAQVIAYYEQCIDAYRKHHSSEGAMHMALNRGDRFDSTGFYGQLERIAKDWQTQPPLDVLELGFGQGFNLAHLAAKFPRIRFSGIDLTPVNQTIATQRLEANALGNVVLSQGDFQRMPYAQESFDHAFAIEAFCYATDLDRALAEIHRVLRPGGTMTLFDGYLLRRPETFSADEALAAELVAKGVALESFQIVDDLLAKADQAGLQVRSVTAFDSEIMPNLRKLERLTGAILRFPWLGRRAMARRPAMRTRNLLCGYLIHSTVALGITVYREIVLQKPPGIGSTAARA